jgi:hypothetical protein
LCEKEDGMVHAEKKILWFNLPVLKSIFSCCSDVKDCSLNIFLKKISTFSLLVEGVHTPDSGSNMGQPYPITINPVFNGFTKDESGRYIISLTGDISLEKVVLNTSIKGFLHLFSREIEIDFKNSENEELKLKGNISKFTFGDYKYSGITWSFELYKEDKIYSHVVLRVPKEQIFNIIKSFGCNS